MWQIGSGRIPNPVRRIAIGSAATVAVSALGVALMLPNHGYVAADVLDVAAIDESSSTLGFADSDMYGMTPAQVDQRLDQMQAMGVNNVRIMIPWAAVEFYPDAYDYSTVDYMVSAADSRGMGVLAVLNSSPYWAVPAGQPGISGQPANPADYAEFVNRVAQRYQGKVGAYEIWNEPNSALSFAPSPDPVKYTQLLQAAYPAIKAADPNAVVVGGVTGAVVDYGNLLKNPVSFTQEMYDAGAAGYFDALSFHPYLYSLPFSQGAPYPESPLTQVNRMRQIMVANGDADKLIWASEYGEPTSVVDEATQAAYLDDMITSWRTLGYTGPTFVYTLKDRDSASTDPEATLGVIRSDGTWKPAAYVIQDLANDPATVQLAATMSRMSFADPAANAAAVPATTPLDPTAVPALAPALVAPPVPETPAEAATTVAQTSMNAAMATVASLASMNPATVAATSLAAVNQVAATTLNQVSEMVGQMAAMATGQTPATSPASPTSPTLATTPAVTAVTDTTEPQEVSPLQAAAAALTPTPTGGLGATPESAQATSRSRTTPTAAITPSTPATAAATSPAAAAPAPSGALAEQVSRQAAEAADQTERVTEATTPGDDAATPADDAAGRAPAATGQAQQAAPRKHTQAREDRQGARQDRAEARQDRSDRRGGDRERPRRGR